MEYTTDQMAAELAQHRDAKFQKGIKMTVEEVAAVVGPEFQEMNENPPPSVVKVREQMEGKTAGKTNGWGPASDGKRYNVSLMKPQASNHMTGPWVTCSIYREPRSGFAIEMREGEYNRVVRQVRAQVGKDFNEAHKMMYDIFNDYPRTKKRKYDPQWGTIEGVNEDLRNAAEESDQEAKFEEGKPADPTENMSEEEAKKWRLQNLQNRDNFKEADGAEDAAEEAEGAEDRAEADEDKAQAEREEAAAARTKESNMTRQRLTWKVADSQVPVGEEGREETTVETGFEPGKVTDGGYEPGTVKAATTQNKEAARDPSGLYGYTKAVQRDCEASVRKLQRRATSIARKAWKKDERVAEFLATHAKRSKSRSARILLAALKDIGPKVASEKTARLMSRQEKILQQYLDKAGTRAVMDYADLPPRTQQMLRRVKDQETLPMDVDRWLMDNNNPHLSRWAKEAATTTYGMYGFPSKTARLGLSACLEVRDFAGSVSSDLHRRRASLYEPITGFLGQHAKAARCYYSRLILGSYPDSSIKIASATPKSVGAWLQWED